MAVKVINTVPHPSVVKEVVCRNCGSTLQYTPDDVQTTTHYDYGGGSDTYRHITCPNCAGKVYVS